MSKAAKAASANGAPPMMKALVSAAQLGPSQTQAIFARHCERLSRYFATLAKAQGPEGVISANAELAADCFQGLNDFTALPATPDHHRRAREARE